MKLYTMGYTRKSAEQFFTLIRENDVQMLVDIRLNSRSQLAGFTKEEDLKFFLRELTSCAYSHRVDFAPTKEILADYRKGNISWSEYAEQYLSLMEQRNSVMHFLQDFGSWNRVLLLCSEPTPEHCHRRLLAECIANKEPSVEIVHI